MTWFTITIYVALAAFTATYAVPASARAERALSQRSSSSLFEPAMSAATEAPESAAAAPTQQRGAASQAHAPNSIATGTEAVTLPAVSPPTGTKKGTSPANTLIKQATAVAVPCCVATEPRDAHAGLECSFLVWPYVRTIVWREPTAAFAHALKSNSERTCRACGKNQNLFRS